MVIRLTADVETTHVLARGSSAQSAGAIAKRMDVVTVGLYAGLTVDDLTDLDLSYTPSLGSPWDPLQTAAQAWLREHVAGKGSPLTSASQTAK
jgi:hypothetical protein